MRYEYAMTLVPKLSMLPAPQRALWLELGATPSVFTLYGGTALALRLGHRAAVDFDFFSNANFDPDRLAATAPYLRTATPIAAGLVCAVNAGTKACQYRNIVSIKNRAHGKRFLAFWRQREEPVGRLKRAVEAVDVMRR